MLNEYKISEIPAGNCRVWGRTTSSRSPLTLFWTGSGLELNVQGGELWVEVETSYSILEQWAALLINGALISRHMLEKGRHWICLFRGMDPDRPKNVRFLKEVQAMPNDPEARMQIHALKVDGQLLPVSRLPYKLEFIGDSITSGEGLIGAREEEDWIPMFFSSAYGYPMLTAEACGAEYRAVSQSGWGVLSSWDNNPYNVLPRVYTQICGPLEGEANGALGAYEENDFAAWQPDVVVVNLGTNDGGALNQPPWQDPATGESFRQARDAKGRESFQNAAVNFLKLLRAKNPGAYLLWAYGMLGREMAASIREAVARYQVETGDRRAAFLLLPDTTEETFGSRQHSGKAAHAQAAAVLSDSIQSILHLEG